MVNRPWWADAVIYHVYLRSFADSNDDDVGDLPGLRSRLEYLRWLGVDSVLLSPFYPSPMIDFGYDVRGYLAVDPEYGSMADFEELLSDAHRSGIRIIIDYIPNHTSNLHHWFQQARADRNSPYRDWYFWRDPGPDGGPPNNWISAFGMRAWTWDVVAG
jgi:alpha-glucosidase